MMTRHADDDGGPLCGETVADSTGLVITITEHAEVDCCECADMLGIGADHPCPVLALEGPW